MNATEASCLPAHDIAAYGSYLSRYARNISIRSAFGGITSLCVTVAEQAGLDTDLAFGLGTHLTQRFAQEDIPRREAATVALDALFAYSEALPEGIAKARGFNYLQTDAVKPVREHLGAGLENARYWMNGLGPEFFTRSSQKQGNYFRGPIGAGFAVSAKGGSGAGAISLDLAIEHGYYEDDDHARPSHELWRVGLDTDVLRPGGSVVPRIGRIIRTGSGVKPGDERKTAEFQRFRSEFGMLPQRALTFLAAQTMYDLGFDEAMALNTEGALRLSSLKRSTGKTDYSGIHQSMGFRHAHNPHWLAIPDLQRRFYDTVVAPSSGGGLMPHEPHRLQTIVAGFNTLTHVANGQPFPVRLCQDNSATELSRAFDAYLRLQGRYQI